MTERGEKIEAAARAAHDAWEIWYCEKNDSGDDGPEYVPDRWEDADENEREEYRVYARAILALATPAPEQDGGARAWPAEPGDE